jgi:uncharacterized membrane protein
VGKARRILIVGETWISHTIHTKGFDSFTTSSSGEGYSFLKRALEAQGFMVDVITNHNAPTHFPSELKALQAYDTIVLSDIGANTLLLTRETWSEGRPTVNRLQLVADYVTAGGGLIMVGGYLTFMGIEGKGFWRGTAVEQVLPVRMLPHDDRVERPEGLSAKVVAASHSVMRGLDGPWPALLGYNRVQMADGALLAATISGDPLVATITSGRGRTAVFTSDCSPHWCPIEFINWPGYATLWANLCDWTSGGDARLSTRS